MLRTPVSTFLNSQAFLKFKAIMRPYPTSGRYLVGVSGGRDSVALLRMLLTLGYEKLIVCHLNHGLRGKASSLDAQFVKRLATRWDLDYIQKKVDVSALAKTTQHSLETAAREARYQFFCEVAEETKCDMLLLGHHADDQVETFLFRLLRGSGVAGLSAMQVHTMRRGLHVVRPLLHMWRKEIDSYLSAIHQHYREDSTNIELHHTRNRVRLKIIPALEKWFGRDVRSALWRTVDILAAEDEWLETLCQDVLPQNTLPEQLPVAFLKGQPVAKQRRILRLWLKTQNASNIGYREIEAVRSLIETQTSAAKVNLAQGKFVRRRNRVLYVETNALGET